MSASPALCALAVCFTQGILTFQARMKHRYNFPDEQQWDLKDPRINTSLVNRHNQSALPQTIPKDFKLRHTTLLFTSCNPATKNHSNISNERNERVDPCLEIRRGKRRRGSKRCKPRSNAWRPLVRSNSSRRETWYPGEGPVSNRLFLDLGDKELSSGNDVSKWSSSAAAAAADDANRTSAEEPKNWTLISLWRAAGWCGCISCPALPSSEL